MPVSFDQVREMALALPEVEEATSYGMPAFRVRKKFFLWLKHDGDTVVLRINPFEREYLLEAEPEAFFITGHYRDYPAVLARASVVDRVRLRERIEDAWRMMAPKRLVDAWDQQSGA